jgi:hypothetical protein
MRIVLSPGLELPVFQREFDVSEEHIALIEEYADQETIISRRQAELGLFYREDGGDMFL